MTTQEQRPSSALASNRIPSFTGLKPLILAKTSSTSSPRQPKYQTYSASLKKANTGVLGYGGNGGGHSGAGLGLVSNNKIQRRSTSARQPKLKSQAHMIISYQLSPEVQSDLSLDFSPISLHLDMTSPSQKQNSSGRRTRSETFKFPLPPSFNLENQILSLRKTSDQYQNLEFSSDSSSSQDYSPNLQRNHHHGRRELISQSWKNDAQSWINEKSPSNFGGDERDWSDFGSEKERIRLHLEAQAQLGGSQGWSPETESLSSPTFPSQPIGLGLDSEEGESVTAPLFSRHHSSLKHRDSQDTVTSSIRSWAFSTAAASSLDCSERISLAPPSYSSTSGSVNESRQRKESQASNGRRRSNSILPPAYGENHSESAESHSQEKEAGEYPFPLMTNEVSIKNSSELGDVEDEEKLRRLNESFLLLGQATNEEVGEEQDEEEKDVQLPHEGLGNLSPFVNPFALEFDSNREFTAPSLAEQMAYACGSGMGYLSADEEQKLGWEARGLRTQIKHQHQEGHSDEDDVYLYDEDRAEIESSWSAHGEGIQNWDQVESEDEFFWRSNQSSSQEMIRNFTNHPSTGHYKLGQGLGRAGALRRNPTSASIRTLSILSGSSASSSPILSGVLAAPRPRAVTYGYQGEKSPVDIDSLFSRPLSIEIEQGESFAQEESAQVQTQQIENEDEFDDFAYLLDDSVSDFRIQETTHLQSSITVPADLNTIIQPSPALSTPSLDFLQTPEMLASLPSPIAKGGRRIGGLPSLSSCPILSFQSSSIQNVDQSISEDQIGLPSSSSTSSNLSVLDRPRPFSRCESGVEYIQIPKKVKRPTSSLSKNFESPSNLSFESLSPSSSRLLPSTASLDIPIRRSSLEERKPEILVESSSSKTQNSPTAYFEETRKALVKEEAKVDSNDLVESRRRSQVQIPIPVSTPSVMTSSSSSKAPSGGRKGLLRNKLSVAALRGLVSSEKEVKKPINSVAMKVSTSTDSKVTTVSSTSSNRSSTSNSTSISKPKSILSSSSSSTSSKIQNKTAVIKGQELDAIRRSCAEKTAFIKAAAANRSQAHSSSSSKSIYSESIYSFSSSTSNSTRPSIQSSSSNLSKSSISSSCSLPTLCVARTPSQRKRGETGLPETSKSQFSTEIHDEEILKKGLNVDGKGVTIGLTRSKSGKVREVKLENDVRLPSRMKEFKQARRISQVKALVHGNPGEDRTLPLPPPPKGILILEEEVKEIVMVRF